jgi:hypothetical protein
MPYQFATENKDYSDYASGRVFYAAPGHPAFPVRLVSEIFQRCQALRSKNGLSGPVVLYDPCCGSAYHLSTLAYLHWAEIDTIIGSDIDADILMVAARNLGLLTPEGLEKRIEEIAVLLNLYDKPSHMAAANSARQFKQQLSAYTPIHPIQTLLFQADSTDSPQITRGLEGRQIDIVLADVPYGKMSNWQSSEPATTAKDESFLEKMLGALSPTLSSSAIIAIASDKGQKCAHPQYRRVGRFHIGKRQVTLLQPA